MLLEGKKGLIYGVRNERSIAWGCARSLAREGAQLALSFLGEREERDVRKLAPKLPNDAVKVMAQCDLTQQDQIDAIHERIDKELGALDFVVHCVAFAKGLEGRYVDTSYDDWMISMNISAYTLVAAARAAEPLMSEGSSIITLTYLGGQRVIPNYNSAGISKAALESSVRYLAHDFGPKGIRVNAISAGPVMTLSARGISDFPSLYNLHKNYSPLRHATSPDEVGDTCAFLASPLARGITGEVIFVDSGYHILGTPGLEVE